MNKPECNKTYLEERYFDIGLDYADETDIRNIMRAALALTTYQYQYEAGECEKDNRYLFNLRKALEGVWGHDLPNVGVPTDE